MANPTIEWKRLLVEGMVILVSILLAFGIDAWWEGRQEAEEANYQIDRVLAELETNAAILKDQLGYLKVSTEGSREFLALCGPDPEELSADKISDLFNRTFSASTLSVSHDAVQNFLASGRSTKGAWAPVRKGLVELLAVWQEEERDSLELRRNRVPMNARAGKLIPSITTMLAHPVMSKYQPSKFPFDSKALLSDMEFEGYLAVHAIRLELNLKDHTALLERHRALVAQINAARNF